MKNVQQVTFLFTSTIQIYFDVCNFYFSGQLPPPPVPPPGGMGPPGSGMPPPPMPPPGMPPYPPGGMQRKYFRLGDVSAMQIQLSLLWSQRRFNCLFFYSGVRLSAANIVCFPFQHLPRCHDLHPRWEPRAPQVETRHRVSRCRHHPLLPA